MLAGWQLMWLLAAAVFAGCKALTWVNAPTAGTPNWKQAAYLFAWPGLDAPGFLGAGRTTCCGSREAGMAVGKTALGAVLLFGLARILPSENLYLVGWVGMIGIVLLLHFGLFHLLSCFWRSIGVDARPLMNRPVTSVSVSEFWGRRWNTAFRDFAHRFLFRPLTAWCGPRWGLLAGFLFSGVVHDLVISIPARGGYGGPTAYFAMQGWAMAVERSAWGRRVGLGKGWTGRGFTILVLMGPVCLLFHRPFVQRVIVPFMRAIGAVR